MVDSRKIKKEKKKLKKLLHFCSKVNIFINTRLTNNSNSKILDVVDKINEMTMKDTHYLDNLENNSIGGMNNKNTTLYNSPFLPGHTLAYNGKKSVPVANPLGSAALGMVNQDQMSLSMSLTNPAQVQAQNIINQGPMMSDEINVVAMGPMGIDNRVSPAPPIVYPNSIINNPRKSKYPPVTLPTPIGTLDQIPTPLPAVAPIVSTPMPMLVNNPVLGSAALGMQTPIASPFMAPINNGLGSRPRVGVIDNTINSVNSLSFIE